MQNGQFAPEIPAVNRMSRPRKWPMLRKDFLRMRLAIEPAAAQIAASINADVGEIEVAIDQVKRAAQQGGDTLSADSQILCCDPADQQRHHARRLRMLVVKLKPMETLVHRKALIRFQV